MISHLSEHTITRYLTIKVSVGAHDERLKIDATCSKDHRELGLRTGDFDDPCAHLTPMPDRHPVLYCDVRSCRVIVTPSYNATNKMDVRVPGLLSMRSPFLGSYRDNR